MVKGSACQCRRLRRPKFNPWVGKIPWRRKWQLTPVFLPEKFHGQEPGGFQPRGLKESDLIEPSSKILFSGGLLCMTLLFVIKSISFVFLWFPAQSAPPPNLRHFLSEKSWEGAFCYVNEMTSEEPPGQLRMGLVARGTNPVIRRLEISISPHTPEEIEARDRIHHQWPVI